MLAQNHIYCMDALEGLKRLSEESVDLVVTDPPYNIASDTKKTKQGNKILSTRGIFYVKFPSVDNRNCSMIGEPNYFV